mmetsp:Transcript_41908/g.64139  ORF Transcript_41908/g.64139 Transcript_41908/m.64139 type:complete len:87 (+) Transcript_41908:1452-1712(+)
MTRLLGPRLGDWSAGGDFLEVLVHLDSSVFFVKEKGNFISHIANNLKLSKPIRNFTCDTIPFSVRAIKIETSIGATPEEMDASYNP